MGTPPSVGESPGAESSRGVTQGPDPHPQLVTHLGSLQVQEGLQNGRQPAATPLPVSHLVLLHSYVGERAGWHGGLLSYPGCCVETDMLTKASRAPRWRPGSCPVLEEGAQGKGPGPPAPYPSVSWALASLPAALRPNGCLVRRQEEGCQGCTTSLCPEVLLLCSTVSWF